MQTPDAPLTALNRIANSIKEHRDPSGIRRGQIEKKKIWKETLGIANGLIKAFGHDESLRPGEFHERATDPVTSVNGPADTGFRLRQSIVYMSIEGFERYKITRTKLEVVDTVTLQEKGIGFEFHQVEKVYRNDPSKPVCETQARGPNKKLLDLINAREGAAAIRELKGQLEAQALE